MSVNEHELGLMRLVIPDADRARHELQALGREDGIDLVPSDTYRARDSSGYLRLIVDRQARLAGATVQPRWEQHIPPSTFATTLFQTYLTGTRRAALLESRRCASANRRERGIADPGLTALPIDELIAASRRRLDALDEEYDRIKRGAEQRMERPVDILEVRSPRGCLTMTIRGGQPTGILGDGASLVRETPVQLAHEISVLFAEAGVGLSPQDSPGERHPPERSAVPHNYVDDDYFTSFHVFGDE